ncbi:MAG: Holliday junction branch migration protein RuvA [Corynebacterium sp.]|uniref:Holliday junction branch migration protein RuvA n=1 Tax=Corynebacterium sp. TaxID=1720 RepID=UPI0026DD59DE|nr:Holliday junction branch migration protein RuvA [Corynebacterium sp.]MDO4760307.1 Holliday junction branch migration protein RuvA [Corynebacterium sp.]
MIVSLRGTVIDIALGSAVIECNGVGYQILATPHTLSQLVRGEEARVLVTMIVREDAHTLYGFLDADSRALFSLLQTVSGLGPKLALAAQSVLSAAELSAAIAHGDSKTLQKIPGVGKRMAERMVVDLKDKVAAFTTAVVDTATTAHAPMAGNALVVAEQVIEALVGLGFSEKIAEPTVTAVLAENPDINTAQALRSALAALGTK